jgi:hypothetical protein
MDLREIRRGWELHRIERATGVVCDLFCNAFSIAGCIASNGTVVSNLRIGKHLEEAFWLTAGMIPVFTRKERGKPPK